MVALIFMFLVGLGLAYFAIQNPGVVALRFGDYALMGIPLYLLVIGSIIFGLSVAWIIHGIEALSSRFTIHGKNITIRHAEEEIEKLKDRIRDLEVENAFLKGETGTTEDIKEEELQKNRRPSLLQRFSHAI
ncbi:MAG: DUF1049 domain-containing protein [Candidatus Levybacteria bacterium]|nr:DUF1049 domain-containing protein [Candidatus Levybacteria bacterium]